MVEHQYLHYDNVLSMTLQIDSGEIEEFARRIDYSLDVLKLCRSGKIIFTHKSPFIEFIIPVDKSFLSSGRYRYKPQFRLVNAIRARHYGSLEDARKSLRELEGYIDCHSLLPATPPYFVMEDLTNKIFDVYIGINENVL